MNARVIFTSIRTDILVVDKDHSSSFDMTEEEGIFDEIAEEVGANSSKDVIDTEQNLMNFMMTTVFH